MGWIFALGFAALAMIALWTSGKCSRAALQVAAAAMLLALAGYGWQGNPGMPGKPTAPAPANR